MRHRFTFMRLPCKPPYYITPTGRAVRTEVIDDTPYIRSGSSGCRPSPAGRTARIPVPAFSTSVSGPNDMRDDHIDLPAPADEAPSSTESTSVVVGSELNPLASTSGGKVSTAGEAAGDSPVEPVGAGDSSRGVAGIADPAGGGTGSTAAGEAAGDDNIPLPPAPHPKAA